MSAVTTILTLGTLAGGVVLVANNQEAREERKQLEVDATNIAACRNRTLPNPGVRQGSGAAGKASFVIGNSLSAATGIPGFADLGGAITGMFTGLFRQGANQADALGPVAEVMNDIWACMIRHWETVLLSGRATPFIRDLIKDMLRATLAEYIAIADQPRFDRAGPRGIRHHTNIVENIMIPTIDRQFFDFT